MEAGLCGNMLDYHWWIEFILYDKELKSVDALREWGVLDTLKVNL